MSRVYDNWERLVRAVLIRDKLRHSAKQRRRKIKNYDNKIVRLVLQEWRRLSQHGRAPQPPQIDDELEELGIPSEIKLQSAAGKTEPDNHQLSENSQADCVRSDSLQLSENSRADDVRTDSHRILSHSFKSQSSKGKQWGKLKKGREKSMANRKLMREREKARDMHREALHSTRDTITLVAILIATFTYTAGISPPGGVHQDGPLIGTAVAARKTAFGVFSVCNNLALFTSICVVLVLVSIIPFKRKALMGMLAIAHKAIWVAVSFMAAAYVSAAVVIMHQLPRRKGMDWTAVFLLSICAGSLGTVFVGLGIMLIKHRFMKRKWRRLNKRRENRQEDQGNKTVEEHIYRQKEKTMEEHIQQEEEKTLEEHIQQERERMEEKHSSDDDSWSTISDLDSSSLGYYSH